MSYDMRSFCTKCGGFRKTMPFGEESRFFDTDVCRHCGESGPGQQLVARYKWRKGWLDIDGRPVSVGDES